MISKDKPPFQDNRTTRLEKYCPSGSLPLVDRWLSSRKFILVISWDRSSKLGDFRMGQRGSYPTISVNNNLHPVEFLITLAHEIAHYDVHTAHRSRRKPHGDEWKTTFRSLLQEIIEEGFLPAQVGDAIFRCYFMRERIATSQCIDLKRILEGEGASGELRVGDLKEGDRFLLRSGRWFIRGERIRTRFRCKDAMTGVIYSVHPMAIVLKKDD